MKDNKKDPGSRPGTENKTPMGENKENAKAVNDTSPDAAEALGEEAAGGSESSGHEASEGAEDAKEASGSAADDGQSSSQEGDEGPDDLKEPFDNDTGTSPKDKASKKIEELNDKIIRQMAEFENFRKRSEKEKAQMFETGARSIIEKILPVVDNFERGLAAPAASGDKDPFREGMEMVYRQLMQELENLGVKPIEALGKEFNPDFHNAVMQTQSEEFESGIIAQELQKGYLYRDTVVRHSMVAVVE